MNFCLACKTEISSFDDANFNIAEISYEFGRCDACGSFNLRDLASHLDFHSLNEAAINHYIEVGAGLDFMWKLFGPLEPFLSSKDVYTDIGCGFGFSADIARYIGFKDILGVEDAPYGALGSEKLAIKIIKVEEYSNMRRNSDVILASEVIEHVLDPQVFLKSMASNLKEAGILVLTTPNADFLTASKIDTESPLVRAAFSPGFHTHILSPGILKNLLESVGFLHIRIFELNERIIAYASKTNNLDALEYNSSFQDSYVDYLERLATNPDKDISLGANYRIFKEKVNSGLVDDACTNAFNALSSRFNLSAAYLMAETFRRSEITEFEKYQEIYTFMEGLFLFYSSQYFRLAGLPGLQVAMLESALPILENEYKRFPAFAQEAQSVIPVAFERLRESINFLNLRYSAEDYNDNLNLLKRIKLALRLFR